MNAELVISRLETQIEGAQIDVSTEAVAHQEIEAVIGAIPKKGVIS